MTAPVRTQRAAKIRQARASLALARNTLISHYPAEKVIHDALVLVNDADAALLEAEATS